ncbi:hypothetical protein [Microbacterium sp.]|uniref:hypothetical protein n=1 Tax=Microbacterium sp. TaxID=51671 RepID=UPI0028B23683|nr:hypothetical protein [Microbacterium sp.]
MTRLRRSDPHAPGIRRVRHGRGYRFLAADGAAVDDPEMLARLRELVVPPAWSDVWMCPYANGHILATGVDAAGRRQYIYHPAWHERMAREKFDRMLQLADVLPAARRGVTRDLRPDGFGRPRLLAGAFRMLDSALLRVGSEQYARAHGSIGLVTLRGSAAAASWSCASPARAGSPGNPRSTTPTSRGSSRA